MRTVLVRLKEYLKINRYNNNENETVCKDSVKSLEKIRGVYNL